MFYRKENHSCIASTFWCCWFRMSVFFIMTSLRPLLYTWNESKLQPCATSSVQRVHSLTHSTARCIFCFFKPISEKWTIWSHEKDKCTHHCVSPHQCYSACTKKKSIKISQRRCTFIKFQASVFSVHLILFKAKLHSARKIAHTLYTDLCVDRGLWAKRITLWV